MEVKIRKIPLKVGDMITHENETFTIVDIKPSSDPNKYTFILAEMTEYFVPWYQKLVNLIKWK